MLINLCNVMLLVGSGSEGLVIREVYGLVLIHFSVATASWFSSKSDHKYSCMLSRAHPQCGYRSDFTGELAVAETGGGT